MITNSPTPFLKPASDVYPNTVLLDSEETIVGRDPNCQVVLDSSVAAGVSRQHVAVRRLPGQNKFVASDLDSSNGTYVNGQRVQGDRLLQSGDRIQLGLNGPQFEFINPSELPLTPATVIDSQPSLSAVPHTVIGQGEMALGQAASQSIHQVGRSNPSPSQPPEKPNNWGNYVKQGLGAVGVLIALKFLFGVTDSSRRTASTPPQPSPAATSPASEPTAPDDSRQPTNPQPASDPSVKQPLKVVSVSACKATEGICTTNTSSFSSSDSIKITTVFENKVESGTAYSARLQFSPLQGEPVDLEVVSKKSFPKPISDFTVSLGQIEGGWRTGSYKFVLIVSNDSGSATISKPFSVR